MWIRVDSQQKLTIWIMERAKPTLTTLSGEDCNRGNDSEDCGSYAYVTGNLGGLANTDDVIWVMLS